MLILPRVSIIGKPRFERLEQPETDQNLGNVHSLRLHAALSRGLKRDALFGLQSA